MERVKKFLDELTPNKDFLYIILPYSLGDIFNVGGLTHAVQKRKNKRATVLVVRERMKNLGVTYANLADIILLPDNVMDVLMYYFRATGDYEGDNYIYGHFRMREDGNFIWDETLHLIDRYKKDVFHIPMDTEYIPPIVPAISEQNIADLNSKYILDKRTVIISPYVHSTRQLDMRFWEILAQELKARGHIVYTNTDGFSEKPVAGTEAISTNFRELAFIADKIKCFIGSRNGVFEFLVFTNLKLMNINPFPEWKWDVGLLYPKCNNRTYYNAVDYIAPIANYLQQTKVGATINLSHPNIRAEDIFYTYEDILRAILTDVERTWRWSNL